MINISFTGHRPNKLGYGYNILSGGNVSNGFNAETTAKMSKAMKECWKNEEYREKHLDITPDIKKDLSSNDEKYIPLNHFLFTTSRLNQTHFKEINERVIKYSKEIEAFKAKVYSSVERTNSYHDIEKELSN